MELVGNVSDSVLNATTGVAGHAIGEFGKLVERISNSGGNKPTPIEAYVGMVTKDNPKEQTMA